MLVKELAKFAQLCAMCQRLVTNVTSHFNIKASSSSTYVNNVGKELAIFVQLFAMCRDEQMKYTTDKVEGIIM